ncbi:unnamed protein product [Victoria cruziana]
MAPTKSANTVRTRESLLLQGSSLDSSCAPPSTSSPAPPSSFTILSYSLGVALIVDLVIGATPSHQTYGCRMTRQLLLLLYSFRLFFPSLNCVFLCSCDPLVFLFCRKLDLKSRVKTCAAVVELFSSPLSDAPCAWMSLMHCSHRRGASPIILRAPED